MCSMSFTTAVLNQVSLVSTEQYRYGSVKQNLDPVQSNWQGGVLESGQTKVLWAVTRMQCRQLKGSSDTFPRTAISETTERRNIPRSGNTTQTEQIKQVKIYHEVLVG